jgi:hypothetical protein
VHDFVANTTKSDAAKISNQIFAMDDLRVGILNFRRVDRREEGFDDALGDLLERFPLADEIRRLGGVEGADPEVVFVTLL